MTVNITRKIIHVLLILWLLTEALFANSKIEFWNQQRKGANCFNVEPREQWFVAARDLGLEWVRLTYSKWDGRQRDFLMGDADHFTGIVRKDLAKLTQVLDWAHKHEIKVVLTPLGLPGSRWRQNNNNRPDLRLWQEKAYWRQAAEFWRELATSLKDHPAICAYNIINEPIPEMGTGLAEDGPAERYLSWYKKFKGTSHDLLAFYETVIQAIRARDTETPIMLDAGWYAQPGAFVHWPRIKDDKILYSFHMYEPYQFTSHKNFREKRNISYPGKITYAGKKMDWNRQQIENYFAPFFVWAQTQGIPNNRLVNGEFGCYRRNEGCQTYLTDVIAVLNAHNMHWALYSFREDEWDGMDYELGTRGLGADYWAAKEAGNHPEAPRRDNPLFDVIRREFAPKGGSAADIQEPVSPKVRQWIEMLKSDEWIERKRAAETLAQMGETAKGAVPQLIIALGDEEWQVRKPAAQALAAIGPAAQAAVSQLVETLNDEEWHVRKAAAEALVAIGPAAHPAVAKLIEALSDWEWQVRSPAAQALAAIGPPAKPAIPQLISALNDEEWKVRKHAAQALGAISVPLKPIISALRQAVNDEEEQVRQAAIQALESITSPSNKTD